MAAGGDDGKVRIYNGAQDLGAWLRVVDVGSSAKLLKGKPGICEFVDTARGSGAGQHLLHNSPHTQRTRGLSDAYCTDNI